MWRDLSRVPGRACRVRAWVANMAVFITALLPVSAQALPGARDVLAFPTITILEPAMAPS
jgi:hypothetical protein